MMQAKIDEKGNDRDGASLASGSDYPYRNGDHLQTSGGQMPFSNDLDNEYSSSRGAPGNAFGIGVSKSSGHSAQDIETASAQLPFELVNVPAQVTSATLQHPFQGLSYESSRPKPAKKGNGPPKKASFAAPEVQRSMSPESLQERPSLSDITGYISRSPAPNSNR